MAWSSRLTSNNFILFERESFVHLVHRRNIISAKRQANRQRQENIRLNGSIKLLLSTFACQNI